MSDTQDILNGLNSLTGQKVGEDTGDCVRRKKVTVTEGSHLDENGKKVISVEEPFGQPFEVPYAPSLVNVRPGESVWIEWVYGFSNACAVNSGAWQASDLPNCVIPTEEGLDIQVNYETVISVNESGMDVNGIIHGNVVNTESAAAVTVNGNIQGSINNLGKYLMQDVSVTVPAGTYVEDVDIHGFHGPGKLTLILESGVYINGDWTVYGNDNVTISADIPENGTAPELVGMANEAAVDVRSTKYFEFSDTVLHGCTRTETFGQNYGVLAADGSRVYLHGMTIDRFDDAVYVQNAHADIENCCGGTASASYSSIANLDKGVAISPHGGSVNAKGSIPMGPELGGKGYRTNGYPFFVYGHGCASDNDVSAAILSAGSGEITPSDENYVTVTWNARGGYYTYTKSHNTYNSFCVGWIGSGDQNPRMGYDTSNTVYMAGIWTMVNPGTIKNTLTGKNIVSATVTIARTATTGSQTGTQNIVLYYHNLPSVIGYEDECDPFSTSSRRDEKYVDCGCPAQYIPLNGTGTFELPSSLYSKLKDGSIKGFGIGMNHPSNVYQFTPYGCVLKVTYENT